MTFPQGAGNGQGRRASTAWAERHEPAAPAPGWPGHSPGALQPGQAGAGLVTFVPGLVPNVTSLRLFGAAQAGAVWEVRGGGHGCFMTGGRTRLVPTGSSAPALVI